MWPNSAFGAESTGLVDQIQAQLGSKVFLARIENAVAKCMNDEGFKYIPFLPNNEIPGVPYKSDGTIDANKFRIVFGWGITTLPATLPLVNPNDSVTKALSDDNRAAYYSAMNGLSSSRPGCRKAAYAIEIGDLQTFSDLTVKLENLRIRVEADKRLIGPYKNWSRCMAKAGFTGLLREVDGPRRIREMLSQVKTDHMPASLPQTEVTMANNSWRCAEKNLSAKKALLATAEAQFYQTNAEQVSKVRVPAAQ